MATLGQLLSAAADPQSLQRWIEASPGLARAIDSVRGGADLAPALVARRAVAEFSEAAGEEDWARLMTRIRQSDDPGRACLETMLGWKAARNQPGRAPGRAAGNSTQGDDDGHATATGRH